VPALQTAARGIGRQLGDSNHNFRSMEVM